MLPPVELEVRHLRALCAIADAGSVRKAALQLGMTQPSLTTQLRRIEGAIGGLLFTRGQTGSRPTPLGHSVLSRARPIVAEMTALVTAARDAAVGAGGARLRVGSVGSRVVTGWLRRIHDRLPDTDITIHIEVSANTLLQLLATNQLDVALVHETAGFPLHIPAEVRRRVLVEREPRFVTLSAGHPAAASPAVTLTELADDSWIVDPTADHEWAALRRVLTAAGLDPRLLHVRDNTTAADLVASGEAVRPCQPTAEATPGTVIRPLAGDPLTAELSLAARPCALPLPELDALFDDLADAYEEATSRSVAYRTWLTGAGRPAPPDGRTSGPGP
ncbi:LysR family transcriptional regulator [Streptomyces albireticuli]|uniref:LysR family transcriptional regulator n=1 Tax=Streptomyces albireticuli TaxID=1940 RepID=A0A2A2DDR5_9ACTN|nr:LysR family transcriptional regulator [Streptomyces albireticuli]MCD9141938.1 LysR family transcriptional regulator [Streptomyces albireticuli]MCD9163118.1 LysR family transcriptional regulator [Streptomyces albireticuli]MCD9190112.1 LysR family transcriptional regulator [Streptomyces albireticuli]PAU49665.1 LysR family transcriptional regulator [Streptomyces albireticuli]